MATNILAGTGYLLVGLAIAVLEVFLVRKRLEVIRWLAETMTPGIMPFSLQRRWLRQQHWTDWTDEEFREKQEELCAKQAVWYYLVPAVFLPIVSGIFVAVAVAEFLR